MTGLLGVRESLFESLLPNSAIGSLSRTWVLSRAEAEPDAGERLPADLGAWAWASVAKQSAMKLQPEASDYFLRAAQRAAPAPAFASGPAGRD